MPDYNLVVIGAGSAGQAAARKAAYFGHKVALVDSFSGSLTAITRLRRVMFRLYAMQDEGVFPDLPIKQPTEETDETADTCRFIERVAATFYNDEHDAKAEAEALRKQLHMRNIDLIEGQAHFLNLDEIEVIGKKPVRIEGRNFILASGSDVYHPDGIDFDGEIVFDLDTIFGIEEIPESMVISGVGVAAFQVATIFTLMGVEVTILTEKEEIFPELDDEIIDLFLKRYKEYGIDVRFKSRVVSARATGLKGTGRMARIVLESGTAMEAGAYLYLEERQGRSKSLDVDEAGIETDEQGHVLVDKDYRTSVGHIYAVGDVVKSPTVESTCRAQGRDAVNQTFGFEDPEQITEGYPFGLYTLPEVATYGITETEAKKASIPAVVGRANYSDVPYGRMSGRETGMMKIIVNRETEEVIGVHILGRGAQEVIHYAMPLVEDHMTLGKIIASVYNGSTLHELYNFAALDALYKMRGGK